MSTIKTLSKISNIGSSYGIINEIISFNGKKFKLSVQLKNGGSTADAYIMKEDGTFEFVLGNNDINFKYSASYVSREEDKRTNLESALKALKQTIKIVYS